MLENPINGFEIGPKQLRYIGQDLQRPECILAEPGSTLWSADARGGVVKIGSVGTQKLITQNIQSGFSRSSNEAEKFTKSTLPNGFAFAKNGDILISNFGIDRLEIMSRTGDSSVLYEEINGQAIGKVPHLSS